jgi:hypothetical protein
MVDSSSFQSSVTRTESLADEIAEKSLLSLRLVYGLSCRILFAVYRQPHSSSAPPLVILPLYQNAIDSGFELLLMETNSENYLLLIKELKQLLEQLKPLIHQNDRKVLLYYSFKIYEFEGAILEKTQQSTTTTTATASYQQAFETWFLLANKYHYFGTGNGLLSSYKEGIRNLKKILFLSCWNGLEGEEEEISLNRKEIESIVYNATCVLFHLIKEAPLFHNEEGGANELFPLRTCQATSLPLHLSLENLLSPFTHSDNSKTVFSLLSIYSQSEFIEIFLLFLNCFDQHQDKDNNDNSNSVQRILANFVRPVLSQVDSIHDLDVFTPYFDVLNPSMVKYIYSTLRSLEEQPEKTSSTTLTETEALSDTKGEKRKSIKRMKKVKKKKKTLG